MFLHIFPRKHATKLKSHINVQNFLAKSFVVSFIAKVFCETSRPFAFKATFLKLLGRFNKKISPFHSMNLSNCFLTCQSKPSESLIYRFIVSKKVSNLSDRKNLWSERNWNGKIIGEWNSKLAVKCNSNKINFVVFEIGYKKFHHGLVNKKLSPWKKYFFLWNGWQLFNFAL